MIDFSHPDILDCVERALEEDIGPGDVTSQVCVPEDRVAHGRFLAREAQVVAGTELLPVIYQLRGVKELQIKKYSGACVDDGEIIATVRGYARNLLECERVALNFLQRLGGIA